MRLKFSFLLCFALAAATRADSDFHANFGTEILAEGGHLDKITVITGSLQFNFRPPKRWAHALDEAGRKIVFTSPSGQSAVTVLFTSRSPGILPDKDMLQAQALQAHPGATILLSSVCPTSYQPGVLFDMQRVAGPGIMQRIRHAFVAQPAGQVEFDLTASDEEYEKAKLAFTSLLQSFRVTPIKPKQP